MYFYKGIKSILLTNLVCSLLPWISCSVAVREGKNPDLSHGQTPEN